MVAEDPQSSKATLAYLVRPMYRDRATLLGSYYQVEDAKTKKPLFASEKSNDPQLGAIVLLKHLETKEDVIKMVRPYKEHDTYDHWNVLVSTKKDSNELVFPGELASFIA